MSAPLNDAGPARIAVIFEAVVTGGGQEEYLARAEALRATLETLDGFVSVERFASLATPGKLLSLSFWRDQEALAHWRNLEAHRQAQEAGRAGLFADYRIRVAAVVRDYGKAVRNGAPADSRARHGEGASGR